jgi:hypothetical protein
MQENPLYNAAMEVIQGIADSANANVTYLSSYGIIKVISNSLEKFKIFQDVII